jgi:hypothetical protein
MEEIRHGTFLIAPILGIEECKERAQRAQALKSSL